VKAVATKAKADMKRRATMAMNMKIKFAHMADMHIGAASDPKMRELELLTLEGAFGRCMSEGVDFVILAGDIFHVNIPDLEVVKGAVEVFRRFAETGRRIYIVYGSHDFSPNAASIIDIVEAAGLVTRVGKPSGEGAGEKLMPEVVKDGRTGALLTGISGRRGLRERDAFEALDREWLGRLEGFRIFVFHTALDEIKGEDERYESMPSSLLPEGFDYYAGGHIHKVIDMDLGGRRVVYPGPLFTGWGGDLEATASGVARGFFMVEADGSGRVSKEFIETTPFKGELIRIEARGETASQLNARLEAITGEHDVGGKVVVLKVSGEISSGRTSDIDFAGARRRIADAGAIYVHLSRNQLRAREMESASVHGETTSQIEDGVLREMAGEVKGRNERLTKSCVEVARQLLAQLRSPKLEGETQRDYDARMMAAAKSVLGADAG
jgi:DNA repair exonuclease SbcCD nuclease subunit